MAAQLAGAGPQIEQMIGRAQDVGVVLDDENGVAQVAQLFEDANQAGCIARMQADRRLVKDIERAH